MKEITNEQIQELLYDLNQCAEDFNHYDYGLPLYLDFEGNYVNMDLIIIVRDFLNKINK